MGPLLNKRSLLVTYGRYDFMLRAQPEEVIQKIVDGDLPDSQKTTFFQSGDLSR